jgi:hypothetical protein
MWPKAVIVFLLVTFLDYRILRVAMPSVARVGANNGI